MAKARASKKKAVSKKSSSSVRKQTEKLDKIISSEKSAATNKALVDNFIGLQKVMVSLSDKFDKLSMQIAGLLELFEMSAKSLAKKDFESKSDNDDSKKILEKLDTLSEQAGLIGKGLVLIHEMNSDGKRPEKNYERSLIHDEPLKAIEMRGSSLPSMPKMPQGKRLPVKQMPSSSKPQSLPGSSGSSTNPSQPQSQTTKVPSSPGVPAQPKPVKDSFVKPHSTEMDESNKDPDSFSSSQTQEVK